MTCAKKKFSKGQAISAVNQAKKSRGKNKKPLQIKYCRRNEVDYYYCQFCDSYHITSEAKHSLRFQSKKEYLQHEKIKKEKPPWRGLSF